MNRTQLEKDISKLLKDLDVDLEDYLSPRESALNFLVKGDFGRDHIEISPLESSLYHRPSSEEGWYKLLCEFQELVKNSLKELYQELEFIEEGGVSDYEDVGYDDRMYALERCSIFKYKGEYYKATWVDYSTHDYEVANLKIVEPSKKTITVYETV